MAITITRSAQPTTFPDGDGRNAIVRNDSGQHFLISEVHREPFRGTRIDETLVFRCAADGEVTQWGEVWSGDSVEDVLATFNG